MRGRPRVAVRLDGAKLVCALARTAAEQAQGLQGHPGLRDGEGMLFPFLPPRAASFHMGRVSFPIDLLFVGIDGRVAHVVHQALPGTRERWGYPSTAAVIETPGGWVERHARVGAEVRLFGERAATQTYNLLRTLTEAAAEPQSLTDGYYAREPRHDPPAGKRDELLVSDRFRDHDLPDKSTDAMDQPDDHWQQDMGYVRTPGSDPIGPIRMGQLSADPIEFAPALLEGAHRVGVPWRPVALNQSIERAIIRPGDLGQYIHALGLPEGERDAAFDVAASDEMLEVFGEAFIAGGLADMSRLIPVGGETFLELIRRNHGPARTAE